MILISGLEEQSVHECLAQVGSTGNGKHEGDPECKSLLRSFILMCDENIVNCVD